MNTKTVLSLLLCATISPPYRHQLALAFKNTSIKPSYGVSSIGAGNEHRRPWRQAGGSSRSPVSIRQNSFCVVRLAAGDEDSSTPTTISDNVERRLSAASTEKAEILVASGEDDVAAVAPSKALTSTVNERLLSEIQASVEKEKYGSSKRRDYFKDFQSSKTEEERQRSIEEARDLNGENILMQHTSNICCCMFERFSLFI